MSNAALVQDETEDRYYTQVEEGDVRLFTLDQLDAAFNAGLIHENTYVCLEGDSKWLTLAEVAGLGDEAEEEVSAPHLIAGATPAVQAPLHSAPAPTYSVPAPAPVSHVAAGPFGLAPVTNSIAPMPSSIAPMTNSVAPMVMPSFPPAFNNSLALDDDLELMAMRRKRAPLGKILAAVAVLGLGGVVFAVVQSGGIRLPKVNDSVGQASAASLSPSNLKQAETPKSEAPAPVAEAAKPEPPKEEAKPAEPSDTADKKQGADRFSEDMKAALLAKDGNDKKASAGKKAAKKAGHAVATRGGGGKSKGSAAFKSSGNAYDPLNGKL
jgi:hypothetical protein